MGENRAPCLLCKSGNLQRQCDIESIRFAKANGMARDAFLSQWREIGKLYAPLNKH
jgi:hypothetical protein